MAGAKGRERVSSFNAKIAEQDKLYGTPWGTLDTKADAQMWYRELAAIKVRGIFTEKVVRSLLLFDLEDLQHEYHQLILREKELQAQFDAVVKRQNETIERLWTQVKLQGDILRANALTEEGYQGEGSVGSSNLAQEFMASATEAVVGADEASATEWDEGEVTANDQLE